MDIETAIAILGLTATATRSDWLREYTRLYRFWDPSANPALEAPSKFRAVREAYAFLLDAPSVGTAGAPGPQGPAGDPGITVSETAPPSPALNDLWLQI